MTDAPPLSVLLDQNVPREVGEWLRRERPGWRVVHVCDVGLGGRDDLDIFAWAQDRGFVVLTFDEDFADRRMFPVGGSRGVIRLRIWPTTVENAVGALARLLACAAPDELAGALTIVGRSRIRIRRPGPPDVSFRRP